MINGWKVLDCHSSMVPTSKAHREALNYDDAKKGGRTLLTIGSAHIERMDRLGVDKTVVWAIGHSTDACRLRNSALAEGIQYAPDRFIGFATVYPHDPEAALRELDRAINKLGLIGLKVHPLNQKFAINDPGFLQVVREVRNLNIPLVMHVDGAYLPTEKPFTRENPWATPSFLESVVEIYDSPKVMAAHMGGVFLPSIAKSQISFQTTGASTATIEKAVELVGPQRIVWGSDYPSFEVEDELAKVLDSKLTDEQKRVIMGENLATRVLA